MEDRDKTARMLLPNFNNYAVKYELGKGGMAEVFLASDSKGREVVLKVLRADQMSCYARFEQEAEILKNIKCPQVVGFYAANLGKNPFMVLEYVSGGTLKSYAKKLPFPREQKVVRIMKDVLRGLEYLHDNDIVHRDIKLDNILVDEKGNPKITDFGLAKVLSKNADITHHGSILGTPQYMSPEQITPGNQTTSLYDIYSAGVVLFNLLYFDNGTYPMNVFPYQDDKSSVSTSTLLKTLENEGRIDLKLSPDVRNKSLLESIITKMTAHNTLERYRTARDAANALQEWLDSLYDGSRIFKLPAAG